MADKLNYKSVITSAIEHFNDIHDALTDKGAKRADGSTSINGNCPTSEFATIIEEQLQLKATGNIELQKKESTDVSTYATATVKSGSVTQPSSISSSGATVSVSNGTVTLTKSNVDNNATVSAGWVSSANGKSTVTLTGSITTTGLSSGSGSCTITENKTAVKTTDTLAVKSALCYNSTSDLNGSAYVLVKAKGKGSVSVGTGYINSGSQTSTESEDTNYIPAVVSPEVSISTTVTGGTLSSVTTFSDIDGTISSTKSKSMTVSASTSSDDITNVDNKYVVGGITVSGGTGSGTVNLEANTTGSDVDKYVEAMYKRLLGRNYIEYAAE